MSDNGLSFSFAFESYGVRVRIDANSKTVFDEAVQTARSALIGQIAEIDPISAEHSFEFEVNADGTCRLSQDGESMVDDRVSSRLWRYFDSLVRILVAEFSTRFVFIHAGAVGWREKAIVIPGDSFFGKTTLVAELVRQGALYYSDEYAVFDENGLVHPFARPLSIRDESDIGTKIRLSVESHGMEPGKAPIGVGSVLFTRYEPSAVSNLVPLTPGQAIVKVVSQTIAIKRNTEFAIKVLNKAFSDAIIMESPRSDAVDFAGQFLEFIDNTAI